MEKLTDDALATLLLTSGWHFTKENKGSKKALTGSQWNSLVKRMKQSGYHGPSVLFSKSTEQIIKELHVTEKEAAQINQLFAESSVLEAELNKLKNSGIGIVTRSDKEYPQFIKSKLKEQSPPYFFYSGELRNLTRSAVGVVGSRDADEIGLNFTRNLVSKAVHEGLAIVSGGARGVDSTAQEQALAENGVVVSFLHSDLDRCSNRKSTRKYIDNGNLTLLSAVHPHAGFKAYNAMGRNKYIYSQSRATFIVSSSTSGGTWEGALENLKNRWVPMFVRLDENSPVGNKILVERYKEESMLVPYSLSDDSIVTLIKKLLFNYSQNTSKRDIYPVILPVLKEVYSDNKNIEAISKELNVSLEQTAIWIERLIKSESVYDYSEKTIPIVKEDI